MTDHHYGDVSVRLDGYVALIEIHRPPHNYFDAQLIQDLADAFEATDKDLDCRTIVLASEGKSFCAGADFHSTPAGKGDEVAVNHKPVVPERRSPLCMRETNRSGDSRRGDWRRIWTRAGRRLSRGVIRCAFWRELRQARHTSGIWADIHAASNHWNSEGEPVVLHRQANNRRRGRRVGSWRCAGRA